jgi:hypothetical protein
MTKGVEMTDLIQRLHFKFALYNGIEELAEAADELELFIEWKKVAMEEARCAEKEIERLTRERDEARKRVGRNLATIGKLSAENDRLRAALADLEDEVRILLRDNDVEVTEGMSCAIDIAREALRAGDGAIAAAEQSCYHLCGLVSTPSGWHCSDCGEVFQLRTK